MAKDSSRESNAIEGHEEHSRSRDKEAKELQEIRQRRLGGGRMFLSNIEDFVLLGGLAYGALFALLLFSMSSGILGHSTALDRPLATLVEQVGGRYPSTTIQHMDSAA